MRIHRALATATALAATLAAGGLTATTASATGTDAAAVTCSGWSHSVQDGRTGAVRAAASPAAVHTGPYGACTTVGHISAGVSIKYDCYVVNDYGNTWTWVHGFGWIFDDYLVGNGANSPC